jgi:uncharacterized glyoxalase superfamily protein PhnB
MLPQVEFITPIWNVSDVPASLRWFETIGWKRTFTWNEEGMIEDMQDRDDNGVADYAGIGSGQVQVFLCLNAQGSRGGPAPMYAQSNSEETGGCWLSIWMATPEDLQAVFNAAESANLDIIMKMTDQPWGSREFRLLHPDGHTLRINAVL